MKAILFDLYDTLVYVDRETNPFRSLYKRLPASTIEYQAYRKWVMTQTFNTLEEIPKSLGVNDVAVQDLTIDLAEEVKSIAVFEEGASVLDRLSRQTDLYLLSNLATPYIAPFYTLGLDKWIKKAFFSCDIGHIKPSKEAYLHVLTAIGKRPEEVIMVGDSLKADVKGAQACGMDAIWIRRGGVERKESIRSLMDLEERLT